MAIHHRATVKRIKRKFKIEHYKKPNIIRYEKTDTFYIHSLPSYGIRIIRVQKNNRETGKHYK